MIMKKVLAKILLLLRRFLFFASTSHARPTGSPPVITFSYAQEKIRSGDIWRIYISASDPDGDMSKIFCVIEQPGVGRYRPSVIWLKKEMGREFSGYLHLSTTSFRDLWGVTLTLTLTIEDRQGNESQPVLFPLEFNGEQLKPFPPDMEKELERPISTIPIELIRPLF
jgi:hypothetical protein